MALSDFYSILEAIVGSPANDAQSFILYIFACGLGMSIILFVYGLFLLVGNMSQRRS